MITQLRIKNFKAWKDTESIHLAPLTVIFGANSAGKSSLGHLLLALQQTASSTDRKRALHLGDTSTPIDLGTFKDCLYGHDVKLPLEFEIEWKLPSTLEVNDPVNNKKYQGDKMRLAVNLTAAGDTSQPEVNSMSYVLRDRDSDKLDVSLIKSKNEFTLTSQLYNFKKNVGRPWPQEGPEKFYRISDSSMARFQNAGFMADFSLETEKLFASLSYLGPLRVHPRRTYLWSGDSPSSVGQTGESTIAAILAADKAGRKLKLRDSGRYKGFVEIIAIWLKNLGIIHDFKVKPLAEGRKEYEVLVVTYAKSPEVKIADVGFGVSQVLPALVQSFYCPPYSTVWMEQPEIHLHPQVQAELADVFISAIQAREGGKDRHVQLIVESHSEHFLNRLQRRIAEQKISEKEVAVYFCRREGSTSLLEPLRLDTYGQIKNWPDHFFGDEMADIGGRVQAEMQRKSNLPNERGA